MKIGVINLSSPLKEQYANIAKQKLESLGHEVTYFGDISQTYFFSTSDVKTRLENLNSIKDVDFVLAARGGYSSIEVLDKLKSIPNLIFSGCSDFTTILNQNDRFEFKPIHGIIFSAFTQDSDESFISLSTTLELIENDYISYDLKHIFGDKITSGYVFGGNLSVLTSLIGTGYFPKFDNKILFIEEVGEAPYRVHRMLKQLELAGVLSTIAGVIIGSFKNCDHPYAPTIDDVFYDIFHKYNYPVYSGLSSGHELLNLPVPFYLPAKIDGNIVFG